MLQPIMPLIEYQTNKEYIASVLCKNRNKPEMACYGKCYLNKKIEESQSHGSHDHSLPQIDLSKYPISLVESFLYQLDTTESVRNTMFYDEILFPKEYNSSHYKPPIVLV